MESEDEADVDIDAEGEDDSEWGKDDTSDKPLVKGVDMMKNKEVTQETRITRASKRLKRSKNSDSMISGSKHQGKST